MNHLADPLAPDRVAPTWDSGQRGSHHEHERLRLEFLDHASFERD